MGSDDLALRDGAETLEAAAIWGDSIDSRLTRLAAIAGERDPQPLGDQTGCVSCASSLGLV